MKDNNNIISIQKLDKMRLEKTLAKLYSLFSINELIKENQTFIKEINNCQETSEELKMKSIILLKEFQSRLIKSSSKDHDKINKLLRQ